MAMERRNHTPYWVIRGRVGSVGCADPKGIHGHGVRVVDCHRGAILLDLVAAAANPTSAPYTA
eukprot:627065-Rhodomonas_salina.2